MKLSINTNYAADSARRHLGMNNFHLKNSMTRLSSGQKIVQPYEDAGGHAVAFKLNSTLGRSDKVLQNVSNAISFLEVQDGVLSGAGEIIDRMAELKSLYHDVIMNEKDKETYDKEFKDLQVQLYDMAQTKFNGISLFARYTEVNGNDEGLFGGTLEQSHRLMVNLSSTGDKTVVASINKSLFLSAITINSRTLDADEFGNADQSTTFRFANKDFSGSGADALMTLGDVSVGVFTQALQNIASLRAENGASSSQLQFGYENIAKQKTNLEQGVSRIMDVDVAAESTRLAKYNVLVQASASMLSQANGLSEVALVLMR
jgi:flagellin